MSFIVHPSASTTHEVRRITRERLDDAIATLGDLDRDTDIERAVHDVRKRCKEVRAVARLVRTAIGRDFDRFDEMVRDAADALAPIRDTHAMLATFDHLRSRNDRLDDPQLDAVHARLLAMAAGATSGLLQNDERLVRARSLLVESRPCIKEWNLPEGFAALGDGIEDAYRRGRKALRRARSKPTDDHMHEWRKSVKHLWYQTRLMELVAPSVLEAAASSLDDLAEALGDDHDLGVLVERLGDEPDRFGGEEPIRHACRLARRQQDDLRRRAFRLGATIYAETPPVFRSRMQAYWACAAKRGPELPTGGIAELTTAQQSAAAALRSHDAGHVVERERKFLVSTIPALPDEGVTLRQGYLAIDGTVSLRVRDAAAEGCTLTVKGGRGAVRTELEWPLTRDEFEAAWQQTCGRRIHKTRHRLPLDGHTIELDVFHDELEGLMVAEVEFDTDQDLEAFEPPAWFGYEVTEDERFTNAWLATNAHLGLPPAALDA